MTHALGCVGHKSSLAYPAARTTTHPGGAQLSEGARRSPAGRSTAVGDRRGSRRTPQFRVGVPDEALAVLWGRGDEPEEIAARFKITLAVVEEAIRLARPQIPEATKASSPPYLAFFKAAWAVAKMVKLPRSLGGCARRRAENLRAARLPRSKCGYQIRRALAVGDVEGVWALALPRDDRRPRARRHRRPLCDYRRSRHGRSRIQASLAGHQRRVRLQDLEQVIDIWNEEVDKRGPEFARTRVCPHSDAT